MGKGCFAYQALAFASDQRCCANPGAASAVRSSRTRETRKAAGDFWCMMFLTGKSKSGIFAESDNCCAFVREVRARFLDGIIGHSRCCKENDTAESGFIGWLWYEAIYVSKRRCFGLRRK